METTPKTASSSTLHPLLWIAGISVTLLSLAGIASLTGILPTRQTQAPEPPAVVAAPPAAQPPVAQPQPAPPPLAAVAPPPLATPATPASKTPPPMHRKAATKNVEPVLGASPARLPPPLASGVPPDYVPPAPLASVTPPTPPRCTDCGVIANVRQVTREGQGSGAGAVVGGLAGGALANNIGRGDGRTLATILGMVGGGLLGNSIEKSQRQTVAYQVDVRLDDGTTRQIDADSMPAWRIGDKVKLVGGAIVAR